MKHTTILFCLSTFLLLPQVANSQMDYLFDDNETPAETSTISDTPTNQADTPDQTNNPSTDYLAEYLDEVETEQKAKNSARIVLDKSPQILDVRKAKINPVPKIKKKTPPPEEKTIVNTDVASDTKVVTPTPQDKKELVLKNYKKAPLGLFWNAGIEQIKNAGFTLSPAMRKDYTNVYHVTNPDQKNQTFRYITAIFGIRDKLWCIYATGNLLDDDDQASKVLALYKKYYTALEHKYGNAKEHFTPHTYTEQLESGDKQNSTTTVEKQNPMGGDNFLSELQQGTAVLYATFHNETIGVTLGVSVNGEGKSYISIDYKNLQLMKKEEDEAFNQTLIDL